MAPNLPSTATLLGELLNLNPDTRKGQYDAAELVLKYVHECGLGIAEIFEYPVKNGEESELFPFLRIESSFGSKTQERPSMTWLGHLDTVPRTRRQKEKDALVLKKDSNEKIIGCGRGTSDMWGGNVALLEGLQGARDEGANVDIITALPSQEEAGSAVLYHAIKSGIIPRSPIGATPEILVGDGGKPSPMYCARTGRIGFDALFKSKESVGGDQDEASPHVGALDRYPDRIVYMAAWYHACAVRALLDPKKRFELKEGYPGDDTNLFPKSTHAFPMSLSGHTGSFSVVGRIQQDISVMYNNPETAPESVRAELHDFLVEAGIPEDCFALRLEDRSLPDGGKVPFTKPYMTRPDDPYVQEGKRIIDEIRGEDVSVVAASGVAEDGMIFHQLGTKMIGIAPRGAGAHGENEWVDINSISEVAAWLTKIAKYDVKAT